MNHEKSSNNLVGRSKLALIVVQMAGVSDAERHTALEQLDVLRDIAPDLRILFLANGSPSRFEQFVRDKKDDLFQLNVNSGVGNDIQTQTLPVITRIQELPRRLINHKCGAEWDGERGNNHNLNQFVEPNGRLLLTHVFELILLINLNRGRLLSCRSKLFLSQAR